MKSKKNILFVLIAIFILMQFFRIDKTNPPLDLKKDFLALENPPTQLATLFKNACYDCHSHQTTYPWHYNIAPISFLLKSHIKGGRQQLNFSIWGDYSESKKEHKLEEIIEVMEQKRMPMKSYTFMHSDGKVSEDDRKALINWVGSRLIKK